MDTNQPQPDTGGSQEAVNVPVADKLGQLDEASLSNLLKSGFLNEEEAVPAKEEQQESSETEESSSEEIPQEEEDSDQPEAEESSLTKGVQKRINKLVAAKKAAQAELEANKQRLAQLQQELEQTKQSVPRVQTEVSDYIESLDSVDKLSDEYKRTIGHIIWCEENPDGGVITLPDGREVELTDAQVRKAKTEFIKRRDIEIPERFEYLRNQQAYDQQTASDFPWLNKPETEEYRMFQNVVRDFPEIKKRRSDWKHIAGLVVLGIKSYNAMKATAGKKVTPIKKAPAQPSGAKATPSSSGSPQDLMKAKEKFAKNSGQTGLNDLIKAMGFV